MVISIFAAAKHLAKYSNWSLSNLQIQRLIYLSHMFYMGRNNGERLVHGYFEASDYGSINPILYDKLQIYGAEPVGNIFRRYADINGTPEAAILEEAYDALGGEPPARLIGITHR